MGSAQSNPCMALCGEDDSLGQHQQLGDELPDAPEHTDKSLTVEDLVNPQVRRLWYSHGRGSCVRRVCNRVRVSVCRERGTHIVEDSVRPFLWRGEEHPC